MTISKGHVHVTSIKAVGLVSTPRSVLDQRTMSRL
jgi:hypothetical protein